MNEIPPAVPLEASSITDRGLNEKRPVNEDSLLADSERRIFAVADGVGGAEAGEVASQTAIEVLEDAFRHHRNGEDVEDLMELALQRANSSIHQLSHDKSRFSMMATTIVALHLDGRRATIGHVGDSRLYRISPDGQLHRETADHSMVEEEVRAGRMTPEQAATHPSRNVISRALGAEASVEVDLKTIEVEDGTVFVLCSDGITRHIPDTEINATLANSATLDEFSAELKRRCFERGAEDNLTAVTIRVGAHPAAAASPVPETEDSEITIATNRAPVAAFAPTAGVTAAETILQRPFSDAGINNPQPSRIEVPTEHSTNSTVRDREPAGGTQPSASGFGRVLGVLLLLVGVGAAAFYAGARFPRFGERLGLAPAATPTPAPTPDSTVSKFDQVKREIDLAPAAMVSQLTNESGGQPLISNDPEFLYLYGRALLLSGKHQEAMQALDMAAQKMKERPTTAGRDPLDVETRIATAAAALKSNNPEAERRAALALDEVVDEPGLSGPTGAATSPTP